MKYAFVIEPGEHAKLSASSAPRWLTCPGSVALSAGVPNVSSRYAAEGTAAHYIAAECQRGGASPRYWLGKTALVEGHEIALDEELIGAVKEFLYYIAENEKPGDVGQVEQSFTPAMRKLHPEFGGSTDRVMWRESERLLRVYDYKHGAGVAVEVDDNQQLKYYALGALLSNPQWNAEHVELVIAQPRCDHEQGRIRSYKFEAFELVGYAAELIEGARATEDPFAKLVPSTKGCKFCPAMSAKLCPAIEQKTQALVQAAFSPVAPEKYSREQIAEFLAKAPLVEAQISAIREFAYQRAMHGEEYPGFKLVEKRATRKWKDEGAATDVLGKIPGVMKEPEIKSPAQVEKVLGKKKFAQYVEAHGLVSKESSGHTLAPVEDNRPAVTPSEKVLQLFGPTEQQ